MLGRDLATRRLRSHEHRRDDRGLRENLCPQSRRSQADVERASLAWIGMAQLQPCSLRTLEPKEHRIAWRCRGNRALLCWVRVKAGHGKPESAGKVSRQRAGYYVCFSSLRG